MIPCVFIKGQDEATHPRVFSIIYVVVVTIMSSYPPEFNFLTNIGYPLCSGDCSRLWGYCKEWIRQMLARKEPSLQWGSWVVSKYICWVKKSALEKNKAR